MTEGEKGFRYIKALPFLSLSLASLDSSLVRGSQGFVQKFASPVFGDVGRESASEGLLQTEIYIYIETLLCVSNL